MRTDWRRCARFVASVLAFSFVDVCMAADAADPAAESAPAAVGAPPGSEGSAAAGRATLAVLPFQASAEIRRTRRAELDLLENALVRAFVATNKFDVLERAQIENVVDEHQFATSSVGDPANAAAFGKLSGAQYLVVGEVHDLRVRVAQEEIPYVREWKCTETATLQIELRVVQTKLGRIVAAHSGGGNESAPFRQSGPCGRAADRMLTRAVGRVSEVLVGKVLDAIYPLRVVHVAGDVVTLNRGEGGDFRVGSTLDCFDSGEAIVDPDTGDVIGTDETGIGAITITEVKAKLSRARPAPGVTVPTNAICRVIRRDPPPKPAPKRNRPKVNW